MNKQARPNNLSTLTCGIVLLTAVSHFTARPVQSEERPHVSLIDPTRTECTVCHEPLSEAAHLTVSAGGCLDCHMFVKKADMTFVEIERDRGPEERPVVGRQADAAVEVTDPTRRGTGNPPPPVESRPAPSGVAGSLPTNGRPMSGESSSSTTQRGASGGERPQHSSQSPGPSRDLYATGMEAFRNGQFESAFASWQAMIELHSDEYTIQVEIDRHLASVRDVFAQYGQWRLFVVVKDELYWVFAGLFASQAQAETALGVLPEPLRKGGAFPVAVEALVPVR